MRKITSVLAAVVFILISSCQKEEITPSKPTAKPKVIECKKCEAGWDLTDTIP